MAVINKSTIVLLSLDEIVCYIRGGDINAVLVTLDFIAKDKESK